MKKLAIVGASYLQNPLIEKAKKRGIETHVFAWQSDDIGEKTADYFYPISIIEKEAILSKCKEIGIDGICSIASDLASITVNYVADKMNLIGNSLESVELSTNKHQMRKCFEREGDPSPKSFLVETLSDLQSVSIDFPVIVKPVDRSGSRGITKVNSNDALGDAIEYAKSQGFDKSVLVEEFVTGDEYSVEFISWKGKHHFLALTQKYTTGAPNFIETGHLQPAMVPQDILEKVICVVTHALDSLGIQYGASHSELKISQDGMIRLIEIGGRMGGDFIGSHLVEMSTGIDFVSAVIDIALGIEPKFTKTENSVAMVRFVLEQKDADILEELSEQKSELIVERDVHEITSEHVKDSSARFGYYILKANSLQELTDYLPERTRE